MASRRSRSARTRRRRWSSLHIALGIAAVALVAGVAVLVTVLAPEPDRAEADVEQYRDVEVAGNALDPYPGNAAADPAVGRTAPVVTGASFAGTAVTIEPGQPTLVAFLAHWCPSCQAEVPRLVEWIESGDVPPSLQIVGVSTSATSTRPNFPPSNWLERERFTPPVLADDVLATAAQAFGVNSFPTLVMLDADGTVLWRVSGELPDGVLEAMVAAGLAG